ncbi:hypothetical protein VL20_3921 [Microcystis panniformis FACHB-1757]|uniref:Uncharacterized protein n=1 Tax=Microcystis panniformis FACHB-1757 TaxID=1638788 RepID=A0A0K1S400_9CHRO|nr:hypothetical protein VL20_3921 [Microcystis panniformis FACHB-1757]
MGCGVFRFIQQALNTIESLWDNYSSMRTWIILKELSKS